MTTIGEKSSWARLFRHGPELRNWAQRNLSPKLLNYLPIEDLVSETIRYAHTRPEQWQHIPEKELIYYLCHTARNISLSHHRKLTRGEKANEVMNRRAELDTEGSVRRWHSPTQTMHKGEKRKAMQKIICRLDKPGYKDILQLVWFEGRSLKEASRTLGRSLAGTKSLLFRAMQAARSIARRNSFDGFRVSGETR